MDIGDKYFYGEEIPRMLAEIRGACSRVAFWAKKAGEGDKEKFEKWETIAKQHQQGFWPEKRYMATEQDAHDIYVLLKGRICSLLEEEESFLQNNENRKTPFNLS